MKFATKMLQAIEVTPVRLSNGGLRWRARCQAKPRGVVFGHDHKLDNRGNAIKAAKALALILGWDGKWQGGAGYAENHWIFVCACK